MTDSTADTTTRTSSGTSRRGFASMDREKQRAIARQGGSSVPNEKRSFSRNRELAARAGRKGGQAVPNEKRSFSQDRELAAQAGRQGGSSHGQQQHRPPSSEQGQS